MAFVLIQHIASDVESLLTEIIQRYTKMSVLEVIDGMNLRKNVVYIIPPNKDMIIANGVLKLIEKSNERSYHLPIDIFFRSLAEEKKEKSICIVMSGTGSDGVLGLKEIKGKGGLVIAQNLASAEFRGMPQSAIDTGLVDYILEPGNMGKQLIAYTEKTHKLMNKEVALKRKESAIDIKAVLDLLQTQTGHDFSQYKQNTIGRRIERRIAVKQKDDLASYRDLLEEQPEEVNVLYRDLLIGVTSFFRDKNAFDYLEQKIIPLIFENKKPGSVIRIWCSGCSTGEEAYSIAILLYEYREKIKINYKIQIFASDIDSRVIEFGRIGKYPVNICADISEERISKFFVLEPDELNYKVSKAIREMIIFSEHSIIKDPPFSKMDMITCRNVLIYFNVELQKKVMPIFHYALNSKGVMFLGSSETNGYFENLFSTLDRKHKVYQKKEVLQPSLADAVAHIISKDINYVSPKVQEDDQKKRADNTLKHILEDAILSDTDTSGVIVNEQGDILYLHGNVGRYLELATGEVSVNNLFLMTHGKLKRALTSSLRQANQNKNRIVYKNIEVKTKNTKGYITLIIRPIKLEDNAVIAVPLYAVLFGEIYDPIVISDKKSEVNNEAPNSVIEGLKEELRIMSERLEDANFWYDSTNEELKSSNEEMQSINEELQASNEELETSKEELQSINEELSNVNEELEFKLNDLAQIYNDMNNLLSGTNIATIFLDEYQNIKRFTPTATKLINLINSDVGRPLAHLVTNILKYQDLNLDIKYVLDTLESKTVQIQTKEGTWYDMIIQPYRTIEKVVEGVVITFVDITEVKLAKDKLLIAEMQYKTVFDIVHEGLISIDAHSGKIIHVNPYFVELSGYREEEFDQKRIWDLGLFKEILGNEQNFKNFTEKNHRTYEHLTLITEQSEEIDIAILSYIYNVGNEKIMQCIVLHTEDKEI